MFKRELIQSVRIALGILVIHNPSVSNAWRKGFLKHIPFLETRNQWATDYGKSQSLFLPPSPPPLPTIKSTTATTALPVEVRGKDYSYLVLDKSGDIIAINKDIIFNERLQKIEKNSIINDPLNYKEPTVTYHAENVANALYPVAYNYYPERSFVLPAYEAPEVAARDLIPYKIVLGAAGAAIILLGIAAFHYELFKVALQVSPTVQFDMPDLKLDRLGDWLRRVDPATVTACTATEYITLAVPNMGERQGQLEERGIQPDLESNLDQTTQATHVLTSLLNTKTNA